MKLLLWVVFFYGIGVKVWSEVEKGCNHYYIQHYEAKGCKPEYGPDESRCPVRFHCPPPPDTPGCIVQGKVIPVGNAITTENPCDISCRCVKGYEGHPAVSCVVVDGFFGSVIPGCYRAINKDDCCPSEELCQEPDDSLFVCVYEGVTFRPDEQVPHPSSQDPCLKCACGRGWTGDAVTNPNCWRHYCLVRDSQSLISGCLAIYQEDGCCPAYFECGENIPNTTTPLATNEEIVSGNACVFQGSHYRIGQFLDTGNHPFLLCVTCQCTVPPEFTCVRAKTCQFPDPENLTDYQRQILHSGY